MIGIKKNNLLNIKLLVEYSNYGKYLLFYNLLERFTFIVFYISISRFVDKDTYGLIVSIFSLTNIISSFFDLGLPFFIQRESAKGSFSNEQLRNTLILKFLIIFILIPIPIIYFINEKKYIFSIVLISIINFYYPINQIIVFYLNGKNLFKETFYSMFYSRILLFIVLIIFIPLKIDLNLRLLTILIILILQTKYLFNFIDIKENLKQQILNLNLIKNIIKSSFPIGFSVIFMVIYDRIDVLIIRYFIGDESVATYSVAYSLFRLSTIFSSVILLQSYNKYSINKSLDINLSLSLIKKDILLLLIVAVGIGLFFLIFGSWMISFVFGNLYNDSPKYLKLLSLTIPILFFNNLTGILLNSKGFEKITMKTTLWGLVVNIVSNLILVPYLNILGAVISTIFTEFFVLITQIYFIKKLSISTFSR